MNLTKNPQVSIVIKRINEAAGILQKQVGDNLDQKIAEYDKFSELLLETKESISSLNDEYKAKKTEAKKDFAEAYRVFKFDLDMQIKEDKVALYGTLATELDMAQISEDELLELQNVVNQSKEATVKAVTEATSSLKRSLELQNKEANLDKDLKIKEQEYKIKSLSDRLDNLQEQLKGSERMTSQLQETITKVANASQPTFNVPK